MHSDNDIDADLHDVFRILYDSDDEPWDEEDEDATETGGINDDLPGPSTTTTPASRRYTKARFVEALDALVAPTSSSSSSTSSHKRRRIYAVPQTTSSTTSSTSPLPPVDTEQRTKYAPYSTIPLLARLRTFPPSFPSHPPLTPTTLALAGWVYSARGLRCATQHPPGHSYTCERWGLGGLEALPLRARTEVLRRLASSLGTRHATGCGWRTTPSPQTLPAQLRRATHPLTTASLAPLAAALAARSLGPEALRWVCPVPEAQLETMAGALERYAGVRAGTTPSASIPPLAAALALFGWYPYDPVAPSDHVAEPSAASTSHAHAAHTDIVACRLCQRRVGLWAFTGTATANTDTDSDAGDSTDIAWTRAFDLEGAHRQWCPLRDGEWWRECPLLEEQRGDVALLLKEGKEEREGGSGGTKRRRWHKTGRASALAAVTAGGRGLAVAAT